MTKAAALLIALALLGLGSCQKMPGVQAPPARFAAGPLPADLRVIEVAAADVGRTCIGLGDAWTEAAILGCYAFARHIEVVPTQASEPLLYAAIRQHEDAHARGWPADHPG